MAPGTRDRTALGGAPGELPRGAPARTAVLPGTGRAKSFWGQGEPMVWATGAAVTFTLGLALLLLCVVVVNGVGVFWPKPIYEVKLADGRTLLGEEVESDVNPRTGGQRRKYHCGNREDMAAFQWVDEEDVVAVSRPEDALKLDRAANLSYFGYLKSLQTPGLELSTEGDVAERLTAAIAAARALESREVGPLKAEEAAIARELNDDVTFALIDVKYRRKQLLRGGEAPDAEAVAALDARLQDLRAEEKRLNDEAHELTVQRSGLEAKVRANAAVFVDSAGRAKTIPLVDVVRCSASNAMGAADKARFYLAKVWELLTADPREANQDGGLFPAIFGTVLLVFLMAVTCFPLGVLAGVYLGEYAKDGPLVRLVRIAVNNLAGIPSIVYGIFGLGFFVYLCGGSLDRMFYPAQVDASRPVLGQGCILWASLTLGLLTIPVVIVSTEEALRAIPRAVREGSYALGATKFQTLVRVLLPMASPGVLTGFILAMARAVGEVAPLMITGAVKSAPVPLSGDAPFVRLDRQFMHLGYHILDISCKSPNVEATKPLVYVTTLLLLCIVLTLTSTAIWLRNRMRKRYQVRSM